MATSTLETLRANLREDLDDTNGSNYLWSDSQLNLFLADAVTVHTTEVPFATSASVTANGRSYAMPDRCVEIVRAYVQLTNMIDSVWLTVGLPPAENWMWESGDESPCILQHFPIDNYYYLPREPTDDFTIYYREALETLSDDTDVIDVGSRDWSLIAIRKLAAYYAFGPTSAFRAQLAQWARKTDLNVGNPLAEEAARWLGEYNRLVEKYAQASGVSYQ